MRWTDHKNETPSEARRPRRVQIYLSHENCLHKVHMRDNKRDVIAVGEFSKKICFYL